MQMLIDTNVIMDVLVGREPFLHHSQQVVKLCTDKTIHGFIAAHSITNLFYILRKYYNSDECRSILLGLLDIFSIISVDEDKLRRSLQNDRFKDVEDCLQMECGQSVNVSYIVTRNIKDFVGSSIPCLTPIEVCSMFHQPLPSHN